MDERGSTKVDCLPDTMTKLQRAAATLRDLRAHPEHRAVLGQVMRFGLTGILLTLLVAGGYWVLATFFAVEPLLAGTIAYVCVVGLGYVLHSRWSFKGHGERDRPAQRVVRFFIVNTLGYAANQGFIWLLVKKMGGPTWWPVLPIIFVTPLLTFTLNRRWTFGSDASEA
jgi:putative flippase GtrA